MPAPTVFAVGAVAASGNAITPPLPAGTLEENDVLVAIGESVGGANYPSVPPAGWAHVTGSPVVQDTNTQLTVIWRRWTAGVTAASWGDSGDHNIGRMIAIRGCKTTGNPWNVVQTNVSATSNTSATWPGVTTTVADCLVLEIAAFSTAASTGTLTNANYSAITEQMDNTTATGNDGAISMNSGVKATAGATGTSTATLGLAATKAYMTLALEPGAAATVAQAQSATVTFVAADAAMLPVVGGTEITAAAEDWTGSNGAAWDTGRWAVSGAGTTDIQSNKGRLVGPTTANTVNYTQALTSSLTDCEVLVMGRFATGTGDRDARVYLRADAATGTPSQGYLATLHDGLQFLYKVVGGVNTLLGQYGAVDTTDEADYWIRFRCEGTTVSAKAWPVGTAEPTAWGLESTGQTDTASGVPRLGSSTGGTGSATTDVRWDHFRLGNLAAAATTANAGAATVGFVAADAATAVVVTADTATVGMAAADATVSTATQTTANAETATVSFTAATATASITVNADPAEPVDFLTATGIGTAATVDAGAASVPFTAADATVSVSGTTTANAEAATVSFAAADATVQITGPEGAPDAIVAATNLTGTVGELWDDPEAPDAAFLDATDPAAATDLRVSFPTPSTAPGSGGPRTFRVYVRRTGGAGADPTIIIDLWESGTFKAQLASTTVTSTTGQLVTGTLDPADLTDPSGAGVELRVRGVPV